MPELRARKLPPLEESLVQSFTRKSRLGKYEENIWGSLSKAAAVVDVSDDTILRRAVEFTENPDEIEDHPCPARKVR